MENLAEKKELTSESCQPQGPNVQQRRSVGKANTPVMTEEEISDLLARLQDILSLWQGSDSKIVGNYVMTAFPVPESIKVDKVGHDKKVFTVNNVPVVNLDKS